MSVVANFINIQKKIASAAARSGRSSEEVRLVAVTKTVPAKTVSEAIGAGIQDIGENRVQEASEKFGLLPPVRTHLIGHLQANKARRAVELFDWIHSIDSFKLAERVDKIASELGKRPSVLIQVDIGKESTKTGIDEKEVVKFAQFLVSCKNLALCGLMTIPPYFENSEDVRPFFKRLNELLAEVNSACNLATPLTELSMGMSHDFEIAIEEGATMVRIGTALFGSR
ncbi:MAG: YggS family pyridoxal phosphate-dependent enzyme [Blastocatellia bacterium]|nr:YggS family pyridoxal phosphate-dependent enzyme [Blastocatellia bacterium]